MKEVVLSYLILILFHSLSLSKCSCPPLEMTLQPESLTVPLGSQASFTCGGICSSISVFINDTAVNSIIANQLMAEFVDDWSSCNKTTTVLMPALAEYNNTRVYCSISGQSSVDIMFSEHVVLRVQGPPEPVGDLNIHHEGGNMHRISWTAPFTLDGVQTLYNLSVIDENNGTRILVDTTMIETSYNISLIACHSYTFTVTPYNEAGQGDPAILEYFYPGVPTSPGIHNISISSLVLNTLNGLVIATVQYPVTSLCYSNQNITVQGHSTNDGPLVSASQVVDDAVTVVFNEIPLNKVLSVNLVLSNQFGTSPVKGDIIIKTYNIQSVKLTKNSRNGTSCFKCVFLSNSQIEGCVLNLIPVVTSKCIKTRNVTFINDNCSSSDVCVDGLFEGLYNMEVYDLLDRSTINTEPQVVTNIDIKGLSCPEDDIPVRSETTNGLLSTTDLTAVRRTPIVTPGSIEDDNFDTMRTAGLLIGSVCGVLIIVVIVIVAVYIYRRRQIKQGALRINQSTDTKPENDATTIQNVEATTSLPPSFSSLGGPPPYQPPPPNNFDQYPTEQYIIMHSASPRSPTASNSHLALFQGSASSSSCSSVHRDLSTSGHYDHLIQVSDDQDSSKKYSFDNLSKPQSLKSGSDPYSFELKPYHRNEHLV